MGSSPCTVKLALLWLSDGHPRAVQQLPLRVLSVNAAQQQKLGFAVKKWLAQMQLSSLARCGENWLILFFFFGCPNKMFLPQLRMLPDY